MTEIYYVYIMTNAGSNVLYTGVTNNLLKRIFEHKTKPVKGFTRKYNLSKLVYYEQTSNVESAISREKQIKAGSRLKKIELIDSMNPYWIDLYERLV
jgi:putative endonuclease